MKQIAWNRVLADKKMFSEKRTAVASASLTCVWIVVDCKTAKINKVNYIALTF